jgi:DNA-binding protein YbaB
MDENGYRPPEAELRTFSTDAEAQQVVDEELATLTKRVEAIKAQQQQALNTTARTTSHDGHVTVKVDSTGVLTDLTLSRNAFAGTTPEKLARTVLATAQEAAASVRAQMRTAVDEIRDGDEEMSAAREGAQRVLGDLSLPDVPRTVIDPTGVRDPWADGADDRGPEPDPDPDTPFDEILADLGEHPREGA